MAEKRVDLSAALEKKSDLDILLILCPVWGVDVPPLGVSYLKSYLNQKGHSCDVLDINIDLFLQGSPEERELWKMQNYKFWTDGKLFEEKMLKLFHEQIESYVDEILKRDVKNIGFSINCGNVLFSLELARRIKEKDKEKVLIFGGPDSQYLKNSQIEKGKDVFLGVIDVLVVGEGEYVLSEVLSRIKNSEDLNGLSGIVTYRGNEHSFSGGGIFIENLDELPFPDFGWANLDHYSGKKMPILMSRGCVRQCKFCNDKLFFAKYRRRSAENVFQEISKRVIENKSQTFWFMDLMLNADLAELDRLSSMIIKSGLGIHWMGQFGIRKDMTRDFLSKMKKSGCVALIYGVESFADNTLKLMNKPYAFKDIKNNLKDTERAGISAFSNIIVGFPGEGEKEFGETTKGIRECRRYLKGITSLAPCLLTLNSEVQVNFDKYGIIHEGEMGYLNWFDGNNNYESRKSKIKQVLTLSSELDLPVMFVNLHDELIENR